MVRVNDKWDIPWREDMTVDNVLRAYEFTHHYVVVTINGVAVPPDQHATHPISDGDRVQVIHIIGGG
jgi:sulfur carrier protein